MFNIMRGSLAAALLLGASFAVVIPASADVVGVHVGGLGVGIGVHNDHYYDRDHHRQSYSYPNDWHSYHHDRSWYQGHPGWNDRASHDYYRN